MRILVVSPFLPYPPNWGFGKRVYHLMEVLSRTHSVSLLTYADDSDAEHIAPLKAFCGAVHTVPSRPPKFGKRLAQLRSVASPRSFQRRSTYSDAMQRKLDELARSEPFDIIQVESSQMACFEFDPRSVVVLDEHNVEYELYYRMYQSERSAIRRLFSWFEYHKFKREEVASWRTAAGCLMSSAREMEILRRVSPTTPVTVVPNAVDTEYLKPADEPVDPDAIVFTGLMKYRPNVDAAIFFVDEILPRILVRRPTATFYIVGGDAPPAVTRLASRNVVVTGTVDDVRPYVQKAAVVVVPLRMGSGTRLKVLEGLSMGKPMVSTSLGCEGIDLVHREHLLIADEPRSFASAVLELMSKPDTAATLGAHGRSLMLQRYRWEAAAHELDGFYGRLRRPSSVDSN
jgi:sugar transferase (PEP-CTERM/EpsH1 system associated)